MSTLSSRMLTVLLLMIVSRGVMMSSTDRQQRGDDEERGLMSGFKRPQCCDDSTLLKRGTSKLQSFGNVLMPPLART